MNAGEQGPGSEPRRAITASRLARAVGLAESLRDWKHERREGSVEEVAAEIVKLLQGEVGSGHDEQTEDDEQARCATCGADVTTGQEIKAGYGLIWHEACADPPYDGRTVAAVVKELQEVADEMAAEYAPSHASGVIQAKRRIEERFGSSVSGGD